MKTFGLLSVLGALRILRRRATEVGQPGLVVWTDAGEKAATDLGKGISQAAHEAEINDLEAAKELAAAVAGMEDGRLDPADLEHLHRAERLITRSAALDHDIGEVVVS